MKRFIKKSWSYFVIGGLLVIIVVLKLPHGSTTIPNPFNDPFRYSGELSSEIVTCRFDVISDYMKDGQGEIQYQTSKQDEPVVLTFANLSQDIATLKGNASDAPVVVLKNTDDIILLMEQSSIGDDFFYTIFKKEKVAVWQKAYEFINGPYAHVSMGYCN